MMYIFLDFMKQIAILLRLKWLQYNFMITAKKKERKKENIINNNKDKN